jgi:hypothetical protein
MRWSSPNFTRLRFPRVECRIRNLLNISKAEKYENFAIAAKTVTDQLLQRKALYHKALQLVDPPPPRQVTG